MRDIPDTNPDRMIMIECYPWAGGTAKAVLRDKCPRNGFHTYNVITHKWKSVGALRRHLHAEWPDTYISG